ncbi:MAG: hypothetical protein RJB66_2724 [Pseudomonadota bacterium]
MMLRILLSYFLFSFFLLSVSHGAKTPLCKTSLQLRVPSVAKKMERHLHQIEVDLSLVHSVQDLKVYLADPREGGKGGRKQFFILEVFGQILRHYKKSEGVRKPLRAIVDENFKRLEDEMGKYSELLELQAAAEAYLMDPEFIKTLEEGANKDLERLFKLMKRAGWIGDTKRKIRELNEQIAEIDWPDTAMRERKLLFRALRDMFESLDEKMTTELKPLIQQNSWTYDIHMEEGLHEIRRILRWVTLSMQAMPEAFSYTRAPTVEDLKVKGLSLEIARADLEKNLQRKTSLVEISVARNGTIQVSPEYAFLVSGLVDQLGRLKAKSELYFKMQDAVGEFLKTHASMGTLNQKSTQQEIQQFIILKSSKAVSAINLEGVFQAGAKDSFREIRSQTLEVLKPFWTYEPLVEFQESAENAREYWKQKE